MTHRSLWLVSIPQDGVDHFARVGAGGFVLLSPDQFDATAFPTRAAAMEWAALRFEDFHLTEKAVH